MVGGGIEARAGKEPQNVTPLNLFHTHTNIDTHSAILFLQDKPLTRLGEQDPPAYDKVGGRAGACAPSAWLFKMTVGLDFGPTFVRLLTARRHAAAVPSISNPGVGGPQRDPPAGAQGLGWLPDDRRGLQLQVRARLSVYASPHIGSWIST